jgi:adenine-specific DNA-methyltransferase
VPDTPALRKARGAFFTPPELSRFIAEWAVRGATDVVLEPSAGEASFLLAAGERLRALGGSGAPARGQLRGVELHAGSAREAGVLLREQRLAAEITVSDFFDVEPQASFDVVIGNPPYVRYQDFSGDARAKGLSAALAAGVRLTGLTSSWAPFTVHATRFLKPGGRLGLVLPAELLTVSYAAAVRRFLLERFGKVRLVMFEQLVFPGVLEEVVLLLAEGRGPAPSFEVFQARDVRDLERHSGAVWTGFTPDESGKWLPALLSGDAIDAYRELTAGPNFVPMIGWGSTHLGAVTGNNRYFTLSAERAGGAGLTERELKRISPPGSTHLTGLSFETEDWTALLRHGEAGYLFYPDALDPSAEARRYVRAGQAAGVDQAYKCRVRTPWWRVPVLRAPDIFLTYMVHDRPRLVTNGAGVLHLNSIYGITLAERHRELGRDLLPLACVNSLTLLGGEIVGRAYGGGMLKLEPREANRLPVPSPALVAASADDLRAARPRVAELLRDKQVEAAAALVDAVLLTERLGVSPQQLEALRAARELLFSRRVARGRGKPRSDALAPSLGVDPVGDGAPGRSRG